MAEEKFISVETRFIVPLRQSLPPTTAMIVLTSYLLLNLGCVLLIADSLILGITGVVAINLLMFLFLRPQWVVPMYILIAGPSVSLPIGSAGIFSRLFGGNLLFALVVAIGLVRTIISERASRGAFAERANSSAPLRQLLRLPNLVVPLVALVLVGLASIIYSRLQPDTSVVYSFRHSDVSLIVVNSMEIAMLLGLPAILMIAPGLFRTMRDVKLIVRAFIGIGMLYALGTIFAGPLGLLSQELILGYRRPVVFGETSSNLGMLLVLFACIALGQALYARKPQASLVWWLCTLIFSCAVIMTFGRESWIGLGLSMLGMIGLRTRNLAILIIVQAFLILLFVPGVSDFFNPEKVYGIDRLIMWQDAIAIWQRHPYFGVGAGNYQFFDIAYGTDVGGVAHNQFLEVMAEMGVQGLLCLLWSLVAIARCMVQHFSAATTRQGKAIALAYIGYFITIIFGGFFADSFLPSVAAAGGTFAMLWISYPWLLLGLVLTIPRWEQSACKQDLLEPGQAIEKHLRAGNGQASKGVEVGK
ncbi:MAG: O-antigen ligase family protein [Ktedonobacteraceae bacterium]